MLGLALRILSVLVAFLPWRALAFFGAALGGFVGSILRVRRAHVEGRMRTAKVASPRRAARATYAALGTSVFEFLWMAGRGIGAASSHASISVSSKALLEEAGARGRGVVLAASHTGNWDLAACVVARTLPLLVVTKHLSLVSMDDFWQSTRAAAGVELTGARGALARGRAKLAAGGAVAMMIDQAPDTARHAVIEEFLGASAYVERAAATLAFQSGSPLVVTASRRLPNGEHALEILGVLDPPARGSEAARDWPAWATREATRLLDAFVRSFPSQWLWMHRRWKRPSLPARAAVAMPLACTTPSSLPAAPSRAASS